MPAQGLAWLSQDDFSAGAIRSVARHLIPANGAYSVVNGLLDSDGSVYRRGGTEYVSSTPLSAADKVEWVWSGHLAAGPRTLFSGVGALGVLAADGTSVVTLGTLVDPQLRGRSAVVNGMLFMSGGTIYGGSLKAADYVASSVTLTVDSTTVTGSGFAGNIDPGMLFVAGGSARAYVVASVDSDTQITIADPYADNTVTVATLTFRRIVPPGIGQVYPSSLLYATVAERLVTVVGSRIAFSRARSEAGVLQPYIFDSTDYHELPAGALGLAAVALRDLLLVFATDGVWTISNMAYDLTDAAGNVQQQMQRTSQDVVLWGPGGIADYRGSLVVAATDGVYLVDGVNPPVSVSESITPLLTEYVRAGHRPGVAAVFNGHLFLPIITAEGLPHAVIDLLVCRLDRPVKVRGRVFFPWTQFTGHGGDVGALTSRVDADGTNPMLLGGGSSDGRLLSLSDVFRPGVANATDANAGAHEFSLETRDYPTGAGNVNTVRRARVRYELIDAGTDNPTIAGSYSTGTDTLTGLTPDGAEDDGTNRHTWLLAADARHFRLRVQSTDPAARLTLRSVEIAVRPSGKDR